MKVTNTSRILALLVCVILLLSVFSVSVFAESESVTDTVAESVSDSVTESEAESATESASGSTAESETEKESTTTGTTTTTKPSGTTTTTDANKGITTETIVSLVVLGIIVVVAVVLIVKFRVKIGEFLRSVKSELKKVVWASADSTKKNFLVVAVITVAVAAAIALCEFIFSEGIAALLTLFKRM